MSLPKESLPAYLLKNRRAVLQPACKNSCYTFLLQIVLCIVSRIDQELFVVVYVSKYGLAEV